MLTDWWDLWQGGQPITLAQLSAADEDVETVADYVLSDDSDDDTMPPGHRLFGAPAGGAGRDRDEDVMGGDFESDEVGCPAVKSAQGGASPHAHLPQQESFAVGGGSLCSCRCSRPSSELQEALKRHYCIGWTSALTHVIDELRSVNILWCLYMCLTCKRLHTFHDLVSAG